MECSISGGVTGARGKGKYHLPPLLSECTIQTKSEKTSVCLVPLIPLQFLNIHSFSNTGGVETPTMRGVEIKEEKAGKAKQKSSVDEELTHLKSLEISQWPETGRKGSMFTEEKRSGTDSPGFLILHTCIQI